jgi:hypothetical protein
MILLREWSGISQWYEGFVQSDQKTKGALSNNYFETVKDKVKLL